VIRRLEPDKRTEGVSERGPLQLEENGSRPVWDVISEEAIWLGVAFHDASKGDLLATLSDRRQILGLFS
jgi:hypothetical protein